MIQEHSPYRVRTRDYLERWSLQHAAEALGCFTPQQAARLAFTRWRFRTERYQRRATAALAAAKERHG